MKTVKYKITVGFSPYEPEYWKGKTVNETFDSEELARKWAAKLKKALDFEKYGYPSKDSQREYVKQIYRAFNVYGEGNFYGAVTLKRITEEII